MRSPIARAMKSMAPPGASGTMNLIGLFGKPACAQTAGAATAPLPSAAAAAAVRLMKVLRPIFCISLP